MCRRTNVGLGNVRIPDSRRGYHRADTLSLAPAIGKINASRAKKSRRRVTEWGRSALSVQNGKRTERIQRWLYWWNCIRVSKRRRDDRHKSFLAQDHYLPKNEASQRRHADTESAS